ncbi:hypothetical protein NQZ68_001681 [Dissostichus eleginoides]|nr:hypothetical protein NQZ68_001681 [Dissostichus eleginoides]
MAHAKAETALYVSVILLKVPGELQGRRDSKGPRGQWDHGDIKGHLERKAGGEQREHLAQKGPKETGATLEQAVSLVCWELMAVTGQGVDQESMVFLVLMVSMDNRRGLKENLSMGLPFLDIRGSMVEMDNVVNLEEKETLDLVDALAVVAIMDMRVTPEDLWQELKGEQGPPGQPGLDGEEESKQFPLEILPAKGYKGEQGPSGPCGPKGIRGGIGDYSIQGMKGEQGIPGFPGLRDCLLEMDFPDLRVSMERKDFQDSLEGMEQRVTKEIQVTQVPQVSCNFPMEVMPEVLKVTMGVLDYLETQKCLGCLVNEGSSVPRGTRESQEGITTMIIHIRDQRELKDSSGIKVSQAPRGLQITTVSLVTQGTQVIQAIMAPVETKDSKELKESLAILVLLEHQVDQEGMPPLALQGTLEHRVLDLQGYLVPKGTLVLLDPKGFKVLLAPPVLVFQALRGSMDLRVIREVMAPQEFLDDQALQVKMGYAVMIMRMDYRVLMVNQDHRALLGFGDIQAVRVSQAMFSLPGHVILDHLASLGFWGRKDYGAFLESQGLQGNKACLDHLVGKESQDPVVTLGPLVPEAHLALHLN